MSQAQRKKKQSSVSSSRRAIVIVAVGVAVAAAVAIGISSGTSAPSIDGSDPATIVTGQFQEVTVAGAALPVLPKSGDDPALGGPAPVLTGSDFRSNRVTVNSADDTRDTLLVFLAHWCPHCNEEVPKLIEWKEQGLVPANLRVVGITTGSRNDAPNWPPSDWIEEKKWPFEVLADDENQTAAMAYGLNAYPFMAIVDADGVLRARFSGVVEPTALNEIIAAALKK